jgi:AcrR family transcriptional regulator
MSQRSPRVRSDDARRRILDATRELLLDRPFGALTVGDVMTRAGLARTVFYRHFDRLAQMAPELLPDSEDPLLDQVLRGPAEDLITAMVAGLVQIYADNGRWLRALDAAAAADPAVASWTALSSGRANCSSSSSRTLRTHRPTHASSRCY